MHFHLQDIIQTLKDCKAMTQNITATGKGQSKKFFIACLENYLVFSFSSFRQFNFIINSFKFFEVDISILISVITDWALSLNTEM